MSAAAGALSVNNHMGIQEHKVVCLLFTRRMRQVRYGRMEATECCLLSSLQPMLGVQRDGYRREEG